MISSFLKSICFSIILLFCSVGNGLVQAAAGPVECSICCDDNTSSLIGVSYGQESNHHWYHATCLRESLRSTNKEECPHVPGVPLDNCLLDGVGLPGKAELNLGEGEFLYRFVSRDFDRPVSKVQLNIHSSWCVVKDAQKRGYEEAIKESVRRTVDLFEGDWSNKEGEVAYTLDYRFKQPIGSVKLNVMPTSQLFDRHNDQIKKLQEEKQALEIRLEVSRSSEETEKKRSKELSKNLLRSERKNLQKLFLGLPTEKLVPVSRGFGIDMLHKMLV